MSDLHILNFMEKTGERGREARKDGVEYTPAPGSFDMLYAAFLDSASVVLNDNKIKLTDDQKTLLNGSLAIGADLMRQYPTSNESYRSSDVLADAVQLNLQAMREYERIAAIEEVDQWTLGLIESRGKQLEVLNQFSKMTKQSDFDSKKSILLVLQTVLG